MTSQTLRLAALAAAVLFAASCSRCQDAPKPPVSTGDGMKLPVLANASLRVVIEQEGKPARTVTVAAGDKKAFSPTALGIDGEARVRVFTTGEGIQESQRCYQVQSGAFVDAACPTPVQGMKRAE